MATKLLGQALLGPIYVRLYADPATSSGYFTTAANHGANRPEIVVGLDHEVWWRCLEVFTHEVHEYLMTVYGLRFGQTLASANNAADYYFWLNHQQFAEVCACAAYYTDKMGPKLKKKWKASRRRKK